MVAKNIVSRRPCSKKKKKKNGTQKDSLHTLGGENT